MSTPHAMAGRGIPPLLQVLGFLWALLLLAACTGTAPEGGSPTGSETGDVQGAREGLLRFRSSVAANRWAEEWRLYSPNFQRRLNERAGRYVPLEDYRRARRSVVSNREGVFAALLDGRSTGGRSLGPSAAIVSWQSGGATLQARLVRLTRWMLRPLGSQAPYVGYVVSRSEAPRAAEDGSLTILVPDERGGVPQPRTFPAGGYASYEVVAVWLVDDLGDLGAQLASAVSSTGRSSAAAPAQPPAPPPTGGWGSPDSGTP